MSPIESSLSQQFVTVEGMVRELGVQLEQLGSIEPSTDTDQTIADWHYWLER